MKMGAGPRTQEKDLNGSQGRSYPVRVSELVAMKVTQIKLSVWAQGAGSRERGAEPRAGSQESGGDTEPHCSSLHLRQVSHLPPVVFAHLENGDENACFVGGVGETYG